MCAQGAKEFLHICWMLHCLRKQAFSLGPVLPTSGLSRFFPHAPTLPHALSHKLPPGIELPLSLHVLRSFAHPLRAPVHFYFFCFDSRMVNAIRGPTKLSMSMDIDWNTVHF